MSAPTPDAVPPSSNLSNLLYNTTGNNNIPPTPNGAEAFGTTNATFIFDLLDWTDFASWGQFEGLVTAGNGAFDPAGVSQNENDFWFGS